MNRLINYKIVYTRTLLIEKRKKPNLIFLDSSRDRIGIGTVSPNNFFIIS